MKRLSVALLSLLLLMLSSCSMGRFLTRHELDSKDSEESVSRESTPWEDETETKAPTNVKPSAPEPEEKLDFEFKKLSNGTYELTKYTGNATEVEIPSTYQGGWITQIGEKAFAFHTELEKVTFADNCRITTFEKHAFGGCIALKYVEIPPSVKLMKAAFVDCTAMETVQMQHTFNWKVYLGNGLDCSYLSLDSNEATVYFLTSPYGFDLYTWEYE